MNHPVSGITQVQKPDLRYKRQRTCLLVTDSDGESRVSSAGIHSIEHGVMLSAEDAGAMAERGVRLVLTTTILVEHGRSPREARRRDQRRRGPC
jgi:hypothetical protein